VVDPEKRQAAANNHTATHLLDQALRAVLGTHVEQKGSMVTPQGLRFDFSHFQKVTPEEIRQVERMVNKLIRENHQLEENREATMDEANAMGAIALFGEKYGDKVRVVKFGDSVELCGGTHTSATGTLGMFKIVSESAISAGVRRIEAITAERAEEMQYAVEDQIRGIAELVNNPKVEVAIKKVLESNEALQREIDQLHKEQVDSMVEKILAERKSDDVFIVARQVPYGSNMIKDLAYALRAKAGNIVLVLGAVTDGKPMLAVMLGDDIVSKGVDAGAVVREAAKLMQGGGGGQKFFATAGGKNPDGLQAAIEKAVEIVTSKL
jgi:alanyl-tRNA synthetase